MIPDMQRFNNILSNHVYICSSIVANPARNVEGFIFVRCFFPNKKCAFAVKAHLWKYSSVLSQKYPPTDLAAIMDAYAAENFRFSFAISMSETLPFSTPRLFKWLSIEMFSESFASDSVPILP